MHDAYQRRATWFVIYRKHVSVYMPRIVTRTLTLTHTQSSSTPTLWFAPHPFTPELTSWSFNFWFCCTIQTIIEMPSHEIVVHVFIHSFPLHNMDWSILLNGMHLPNTVWSPFLLFYDEPISWKVFLMVLSGLLLPRACSNSKTLIDTF